MKPKTEKWQVRWPSFYERIMDPFPSHWDQHSSSGWHLLFPLMIFTFLSFSHLSSYTLLFFYWKNISFMSQKASVSSASVCRFRTCPQSRVSDDKHHWPLGKHLKSTLHLDSPVLPLSVTRTDTGSLKRRKPPVQKLFLQLPPVVCCLSAPSVLVMKF